MKEICSEQHSRSCSFARELHVVLEILHELLSKLVLNDRNQRKHQIHGVVKQMLATNPEDRPVALSILEMLYIAVGTVENERRGPSFH
jgi:hypothetical protein